MSMPLGIAGLFAVGPSTTNGAKAPKKSADTFTLIDGIEVANEKTATRYVNAIEARHPKLDFRFMGSVGQLPYKYGVWVIEHYSSRERLRYCDNVQLRELHEALEDSEHFWQLISGAENLPGPYREGKPPINGKGKPLVGDEPDRGDYGPLPEECAWIEAHDEVFIRYAGTEPLNWPTGCWVIQKADCDDQLLNAEGVKYVAHTILGMPAGYKRKRRPKKAPVSSVVSLFASPEPTALSYPSDDVPPLSVSYSDWANVPNATPIADLLALQDFVRNGPKRVPTSYTVRPEQVSGLRALFGEDDGPEQTASIRSLFS